MAKKATKKKRAGGRKPIPSGDKKVQLSLYTEKSRIDALGGMEAAKEKVLQYIQNETNK